MQQNNLMTYPSVAQQHCKQQSAFAPPQQIQHQVVGIKRDVTAAGFATKIEELPDSQIMKRQRKDEGGHRNNDGLSDDEEDEEEESDDEDDPDQALFKTD